MRWIGMAVIDEVRPVPDKNVQIPRSKRIRIDRARRVVAQLDGHVVLLGEGEPARNVNVVFYDDRGPLDRDPLQPGREIKVNTLTADRNAQLATRDCSEVNRRLRRRTR